MTDEDGFLARLASTPADDTTRLVYADWLEEQGTDESNRKAEFLRLEHRLHSSTPPNRVRTRLRSRLQLLAERLDVRWMAVVSKVEIENCGVQFKYVCPKKWEQLFSTDDPNRRFCTECARDVHYCDTIQDVRQHAWNGECVAVDLGVIRRDRDLEQPRLVMGFAPYSRSDRELLEPDPVSAERARLKREHGG